MKRVESEFNKNTSAMEKNRKKAEVLNKAVENQKKTVSELEKGLEAAKRKWGENSAQTQKWQQAVNNAKTELNKMNTELTNLEEEFKDLSKEESTAAKNAKEFGEKLQAAGDKITGVGEKMTAVGEGLTKYVTTPLTAMAAASVAAWKDVDEGLDIVVKKTGATGEALEGLQQSAINIATTIPTSFETAGTAIGEVNTRFGLTGTELEDLSTRFIKFAELNDTDVSSSIDTVQKLMAAFGLETSEAGDVLDVLNKTGQDTGISMDKLETSMIKNAAQLKTMGLNAYDAAGFLGQVETSGVNTETVMSGLQRALVNANKEGKTLPEALKDFSSIMNSTATDQEKLNAAIDLFGNKAGPAIYEACKTGSLSFESLDSDAKKYLGSVETTFDNVIDPADNFKVALNKAKVAGYELGEKLLNSAAPAVDKLGDAAKTAGEWFDTLDEKEQTQLVVGGIIAAGVGPAIAALGNLTTTIGDVVSGIGKFALEHPKLAEVMSVAGPAGIAVAAIGGITAAMIMAEGDSLEASQTLQNMLDGTAESAKSLDTATQSLKETISNTKANIEGIERKHTIAQGLVDTLEELSQKSSLTSEEQGKMKAAVEALNTLYPDLKLSINETTGELSTGIEEIRNYIDASKDMMLLKAYNQAYAESFSELVKLQTELEKSEAELAIQEENLKILTDARSEANKEAAKAVDSLGDDTEDLTAMLEANIAATENGTAAVSGQVSGLADYQAQQILTNHEVNEGTAAIEELTTAQEEARQQVEETSAYNEMLAGKIAELQEKLGLTDEQAAQLTDTLSEEAEATEESAAAAEEAAVANEELVSSLSELDSAVTNAIAKVISNTVSAGRAWDDLYETTRDSIHKQLGLFDEWTQNTELTAEQMVANMESQVVGMQNYADNMAFLSKMAAESTDPNLKALVQDFADAGISMAGEVDVLVKDIKNGGENFNKYLAGYGKRTGIEANLAKTTTYIKKDFLDKTQTMVKAAGQSIQKILGNSKLFSGFTGNSAKSVKDVVTNFMNSMPKVSKEISTQMTKGGQEGGTNLASKATVGLNNLLNNTTTITPQIANNFANTIAGGANKAQTAITTSGKKAMVEFESSVKTGSADARTTLENEVGKLKLSPEVVKVKIDTAKNNAVSALKTAFTNVPASIGALLNAASRGQTAKNEIQSKVTNVPASVGAVQGAASRGQEAKKSIEGPLSGLHGKVASIETGSAASSAVANGNSRLKFTGSMTITGATTAAANAKANAQAWLDGHPVYTTVYSRTKNIATPYAEGGFITQEQIALVGEQNKAEVIIPLEGNRSRALALYEQAGEILKADPPTRSVTHSAPMVPNRSQNNISPAVNYDELYSAVATAARQGMQSANIRVYWNGREAGRIMKDMGVQFV